MLATEPRREGYTINTYVHVITRKNGSGGVTNRQIAEQHVIGRYYACAAAGDVEALLACFAADAPVRDEGHDYDGLDAIRSWRAGVATRFSYTTEITDVEQVGDRTYLVHTHLEGNFPGGVVDLEQRFSVTQGLITDLVI